MEFVLGFIVLTSVSLLSFDLTKIFQVKSALTEVVASSGQALTNMSTESIYNKTDIFEATYNWYINKTDNLNSKKRVRQFISRSTEKPSKCQSLSSGEFCDKKLVSINKEKYLGEDFNLEEAASIVGEKFLQTLLPKSKFDCTAKLANCADLAAYLDEDNENLIIEASYKLPVIVLNREPLNIKIAKKIKLESKYNGGNTTFVRGGFDE